jgi:hypothetical protein
MGEGRAAARVLTFVAFITKGCSVKGYFSHNKLAMSSVVNYFIIE